MASVRHLEFEKFTVFVKCPPWELKCTSAYKIWSKSDNFRLRYGDNAIFKLAAVRHLQFAKIAVLVRWPISACDPSSLFQISRWLAKMAPRNSPKNDFQYGVRPPSWICKISIFLLNVHHGNCHLHLPNKFHRNRIIIGWGMEIMLFSEWRPSAILNLRKLQFWSA